MPASLAIIDYGLANLRSVQKAFAAVDQDADIVSTAPQVQRAGRIVLPGVGAVGDAIRQLRTSGLDEAVLSHIAAGRPFLGICLGLQMLFETCYEGGVHQGLGVLKGEVRRFDVDATHGLKVPHMGWNTLDVARRSPILEGYEPGQGVYFVHSYHAVCGVEQDVATTTDYGGPFVSSIWRDNVMATQFHPEKSQAVGLRMLRNFARS